MAAFFILRTYISQLIVFVRRGGRWCDGFQFRGVLLILIIVGQGPIALAVGAGGGYLDIFSLVCFSSLRDDPI